MELNNLGSELYNSWVTNKAHPYKREEVPDSFVIDLRGFCMPTPSRNVTSRFGYRPAFKRVHKGLDIKVYTGDTIVSAFDGKVRVVRYDEGGYGYYVVVRHPNGLETIYGHLSKQLVTTDQEVRAGQPIGLGGNTGRSFGSHLHFETRLAGEAINPEFLFDFPAQDVTGDFYTFHKNRKEEEAPVSLASGESRQENTVAMRATHFYKVRKGDTVTLEKAPTRTFIFTVLPSSFGVISGKSAQSRTSQVSSPEIPGASIILLTGKSKHEVKYSSGAERSSRSGVQSIFIFTLPFTATLS